MDLNILAMADNLLRGTLPSSLGSLRSLESFSFNDNLFSGTIPSTICELADLLFILVLIDINLFSEDNWFEDTSRIEKSINRIITCQSW